MRIEEKDNVSKISQHMGERLVMFYLYNYLNWDVEYVDYVGADLIAIDREKQKRYAISVKTRKMNEKWDGDRVKPESNSISLFRESDANYLRGFSYDMGMEPLVAYVAVFQEKWNSKGNNSALIFLLGLDHLEELSDDPNCSYVNRQTKKNGRKKEDPGFIFNFGGDKQKNLKALCSDPRITWFKMEITDRFIAQDYNSSEPKPDCKLSYEHYTKQQGTFGEYLALWQLGKNHGMRVYYVDSTGADLLMVDPNNKESQYAVSVKTHDISYGDFDFKDSDREKLKAFAKKWSINTVIEPLLCLNIIKYSESGPVEKIYQIVFNIDKFDLAQCAEGKSPYIKATDSRTIIPCKNEALEYYKNDERMIFTEIDFTHHRYTFIE